MGSTFALAFLLVAASDATLTLCEAVREAGKTADWPVVVADDDACAMRGHFTRPSKKEDERSLHWVLEPAVEELGLVVVDGRRGALVRKATAEEQGIVDGVAAKCAVPAREAVVAAVQVKPDGARGWITISPSRAEKSTVGRCVVRELERRDPLPFATDAVTRVRVGRGVVRERREASESSPEQREALQRAVLEHESRLWQCFARDADVRGRNGQVTMRWKVEGGRATHIEVMRSTVVPDVEACLVDRLSLVHFDDPATEGAKAKWTFRHGQRGVPTLGGVPDEGSLQ